MMTWISTTDVELRLWSIWLAVTIQIGNFLALDTIELANHKQRLGCFRLYQDEEG